ncbi:hypothetical protein Tco_0417490 [Tanacetum coccineum]
MLLMLMLCRKMIKLCIPVFGLRPKRKVFCSFVYAHNRYIHRRALWQNLGMHKCYVRNRPWCIMGDFNAALNLEDMSVGSSNIDISMREFKDYVKDIEVTDVPHSGLQFTWNQKPKGCDGIFKKIDRVMANLEFSDVFVGSYALFQPYRIFDHSHAILKIPMHVRADPKPFKFPNILTLNDRFKQVVQAGWSIHVSGFFMFRVVRKLKLLKRPFRKLRFEKGNLHENVKKLRLELDRVQIDLDSDPSNAILYEEEVVYVQAYNDALVIKELFLKQKAKIKWLRVGDSNSAYFHKLVKIGISRSRIHVVINLDGVTVSGDQVPNAFVAHYETFLGQQGDTNQFSSVELFPNRLDSNRTAVMVYPVSTQEVKEAIFSMGNDKSSGLDGYTATFFKEACDIVSSDVTKAMQEFFTNGKLFKELNHTIIALIPKELMHNYHLDRGVPRCAIKVDIQKAYDTVDWGFLKEVLMAFGFHHRMVAWIMECFTTTSFSISINGVLHGYFKGKRGLQQGDPLSPYLFTLIMEVLTLMLSRRVRDSELFTYYRYCSELEIVNLCFANDLFLFAHRDANSARVIMEVLDEFKLSSGLTPSLPKNTAYFCNVLNHTKLAILQILPFEEGRLPVKYLGVPLISSRLVYRDYKELIERIQKRIQDWKNKSLSAARRLQLVQSVLGSMHVDWASLFILPSRILFDIEQLMRGFFLCQGKIMKGKSKVAWEVVCMPKSEGGLGVRRLELFNKALMISHIWNLISLKQSLWGSWHFPSEWSSKYPNLNMSAVPLFTDLEDVLEWRDLKGGVHPFLISIAWDCIRPRQDKEDWSYVDTLSHSNAPLLCSLCERTPDSHDHLFFECVFSNQVWDHLKVLAGLNQVSASFASIMSHLVPISKRRHARSVIARIVVATYSRSLKRDRSFVAIRTFWILSSARDGYGLLIVPFTQKKDVSPFTPTLGPGIYLGAVERATSFITDDLWYGIIAGVNPDFLVVGENQQTFDLEGDSGSLIVMKSENDEKPRPIGIILVGTANRGRLKLKVGQPPENWTSGVDLGRLLNLLELDLITTSDALKEQIAVSATGVGSTGGDSSPPEIVLPEDKAEPLGLHIQQHIPAEEAAGSDMNLSPTENEAILEDGPSVAPSIEHQFFNGQSSLHRKERRCRDESENLSVGFWYNTSVFNMATYSKPENALKRADELTNVGQNQDALQVLHDIITSRRYRAWQKPHEKIMFKYIELCVDMRRGRFAKDGLIQYRIICQQVNVASLEEVIKYFIDLSTKKAELARSQAQALEDALDVDDLEADNRPRELVTPWFKFLWQTYRTVLEILRNNSKLMALYAVRYSASRTTEFRRLCEIIRNHLANLNKYRDQRDRPDLSAPGSQHFFLDTRF